MTEAKLPGPKQNKGETTEDLSKPRRVPLSYGDTPEPSLLLEREAGSKGTREQPAEQEQSAPVVLSDLLTRHLRDISLLCSMTVGSVCLEVLMPRSRYVRQAQSSTNPQPVVTRGWEGALFHQQSITPRQTSPGDSSN